MQLQDTIDIAQVALIQCNYIIKHDHECLK